MAANVISSVTIPKCRILGVVTPDRRYLLSCIDVIVGYVRAKYRFSLAGWHIEAVLAKPAIGLNGETVSLRAIPLDNRSVSDLPPVPMKVFLEIAFRIEESISGVTNIVPDLTSVAPDLSTTPSFGTWTTFQDELAG